MSASAHNLLVPAPGPDDVDAERKRVAYPLAITIRRRRYRTRQHPVTPPSAADASLSRRFTTCTSIAVEMGRSYSFAVLEEVLIDFDFVVMRFLMKLFRTANKDIIDECRSFCNFPLPTEMLEIKSNRFCKKIKCNKSMLRYFNISVS